MPKRLIVLSPATYTLTQEDGTDTTSEVVAKVAGSIDQASPTIGDTLTVTGDNTSALAGFRAAEVEYIWEESADGSTGWSAISGATSASLDTSSGVTDDYYVRRGWRGPNDTAYARTAAVQVVAAGVEFTDTFDQPNGTDLSTLSDYTLLSGIGGAATNGSGEWVIPASAANEFQILAYTGTLANDQFAEIVLGSAYGQDYTAKPLLFVRAADGNNYYEIDRQANNRIVLNKRVAGANTQLSAVDGATIPAGARIRAEVQGDQITVLVNGSVYLGPVTDTSLASGSAGLGLAGLSSATADVSLTEFKCGDL